MDSSKRQNDGKNLTLPYPLYQLTHSDKSRSGIVPTAKKLRKNFHNRSHDMSHNRAIFWKFANQMWLRAAEVDTANKSFDVIK